MSEALATASRYQPARVCKKVTERFSGSVQGSNLNHIEEDIDIQNHGCEAILTHSPLPTWHQQEKDQLVSDKPASLTPQGLDTSIQFFDAGDPAHLFSAIRWGEMRAVREWCKSDAIDVTTTDVTGRTVLHLGAEQGGLGLFDFLLRQSGVDIDAVDVSGKTALFYAAQRERAALVQRLLCSYGASVDIRDVSGRTPLSHAAECNSYRSMELLLEAGADVTSKDDLGRAPLFFAVRAGNCATTVRLVRYMKSGSQALVLAAQLGKAKIENKLMNMGKDVVDWGDGNLQKLLLQSAHSGRDDMVRVLLHLHEVEADTRDSEGRTPLSLAADMGHRNIIRILSRRGANRNLRDKKSRSPVDYASQHGPSTYRCIIKNRIQRLHHPSRLVQSSGREHQHRVGRFDGHARRVRKS